VVGVITDGLTQVVTRAPGLVFVSEAGPSDGPGGNPSQLRRIRVQEPAFPQFTRLGGAIPVRVQLINLPADAPVRVFLAGTSVQGDELRVDVTPPNYLGNTSGTAYLLFADETIPNKWWPREFTLEAEVTVDGVRYSAKAPGSVWIRQEVEVRSVRMINYWCWDEGEAVRVDTPFFGLEIDWYGGGFDDAGGSSQARLTPDDSAPVQFWLALDGAVPGDVVDNATHRRLLVAAASPNDVQTARVHFTDLIGIDLEDFGQPPGQLQPALENGEYPLLTVTETPLFGRLTSGPDADPIEVCFPLPVSP